MTDASSKKCFECDVNLPVSQVIFILFGSKCGHTNDVSAGQSLPSFFADYSIFLYSHFSNTKITSASAEYIKSEQVDASHLGLHSSGRSPPILMMMCQ